MKKSPELKARTDHAISLRTEGRFEEAAREFELILADFPDDAISLLLLAFTLHLNLKDSRRAQALFTRHVELRPRSIKGSMGLILSSFELNDVDAGFKELQRFLRSDRESWEHERLLADIVLENPIVPPPFFELGAELWLKNRHSTKQSEPGDEEKVEEQDVSRDRESDTPAGVKWFADLDEHVKAELRLAEEHYENEAWEAATAIAEKHLDSYWDAPGVLAIVAGFFLYGSNEPEKAVKLLKRSVELDPGSWYSSLRLVMAYRKTGEPDLAFEELDRFVFEYEAEEHERFLQRLLEKHGEHWDRAVVLAAELWANTVRDWPDDQGEKEE